MNKVITLGQRLANDCRESNANICSRTVRKYTKMVADAVIYEPVSTLKFPANREKNREFFNFGPAYRSEDRVRPMISGLLSQIPYSTEQGISTQEQGI